MPDILQTLRLETDPNTNVYPNILEGNIPNGAVTEDKISSNSISAAKLKNGAVNVYKISFVSESLYDIRPQTMAELVNVLMKVLLDYEKYKVYYYRETEYGADFSTIDFNYNSTNNVLVMYVGGVTSTISDDTSFNAFMAPYAQYIFIQKVGS